MQSAAHFDPEPDAHRATSSMSEALHRRVMLVSGISGIAFVLTRLVAWVTGSATPMVVAGVTFACFLPGLELFLLNRECDPLQGLRKHSPVNTRAAMRAANVLCGLLLLQGLLGVARALPAWLRDVEVFLNVGGPIVLFWMCLFVGFVRSTIALQGLGMLAGLLSVLGLMVGGSLAETTAGIGLGLFVLWVAITSVIVLSTRPGANLGG